MFVVIYQEGELDRSRREKQILKIQGTEAIHRYPEVD
jgi:hypothetical protein